MDYEAKSTTPLTHSFQTTTHPDDKSQCYCDTFGYYNCDCETFDNPRVQCLYVEVEIEGYPVTRKPHEALYHVKIFVVNTREDEVCQELFLEAEPEVCEHKTIEKGFFRWDVSRVNKVFSVASFVLENPVDARDMEFLYKDYTQRYLQGNAYKNLDTHFKALCSRKKYISGFRDIVSRLLSPVKPREASENAHVSRRVKKK